MNSETTTTRFKTFKEFWPFYVREHSKPATRTMHFIGTSIGFLCLANFAVTGRWHFLLIGLVAGYLFAWIAHFKIEKNRPATFKYPLWSFIADWKMWSLMLTGQMDDEVRRSLSANILKRKSELDVP